ncbi:MAG TPA: hypothetical protein VN915_01540, partial [Elusimicrobiota bacterium]|nr:hypothetical protein [Elusimicrobiota bacterium]
DTLPAGIVAKLDKGDARVDRGELLGRAVEFPVPGYNHVHYNIVLPDGTRVNPEYASTLLPDRLAPEILRAFSVSSSGDAAEFAGGPAAPGTAEFVLHVVDKQDANVYEHPPAYARLKFDSGAETVWDFRRTLTGPGGAFPPLWDYFRESLGGYSTEGGYGTGASLIRLKVPAGARGAFTLEAGDVAGNVSSLRGILAAEDSSALAELRRDAGSPPR